MMGRRAWTLMSALICVTAVAGCATTKVVPAIQTASTKTTSIQTNATNTPKVSSSNTVGSNTTMASGSNHTTNASLDTAPTTVDSPPANDKGAWTDPTTLAPQTHWNTNNYKQIAKKLLVPEVYSLPQGEVAITIDDGPSPYTAQILSTLEKYHAHVTFFDVGQNVEAYPDVVKRAAADGDLIEDHSMTHPNFFTITPAQQEQQINQDAHIIYNLTKEPVRLFRPPYENFDNVTEQILQRNGMELALWNRDPRDWAAKTPQQIVNGVLDNNPSGAVFDMHDKLLTMEALPAILQGIAKMHLKMVVLPSPNLSSAMKSGSVPVIPPGTEGQPSSSTKQTSNTSTANSSSSSKNATGLANQSSNSATTAKANTTNGTGNATTANVSSNNTSNQSGNTTVQNGSHSNQVSNQTSNGTPANQANRTANAVGNVAVNNTTSASANKTSAGRASETNNTANITVARVPANQTNTVNGTTNQTTTQAGSSNQTNG